MDKNFPLLSEYRVLIEERNLSTGNFSCYISRAVIHPSNHIQIVIAAPSGKTPAALWTDFAEYSAALERPVLIRRNEEWGIAEAGLNSQLRDHLVAAETALAVDFTAVADSPFRIGFDSYREHYAVYRARNWQINIPNSLQMTICSADSLESLAAQWLLYRSAFQLPILLVNRQEFSSDAEILEITDEYLEVAFEYEFS